MTVLTRGVEQTGAAEMQHHLGHASGEKDLHGGEVARAVGQSVDQARTWRLMRSNLRPWDGEVQRRGRWREDAAAGWSIRRRLRARPSRSGWRRRVRMSRYPCCVCCMRRTARAERSAASSQMGWPDGASAAWGSESPRASATTCDVAAVPRNWQPPPGEAQARQPISAAYSSVIYPWAKRAPMV